MAKGFVFLELLIVLAIIGILSSIALPAYQDYVYRLNIAEGLLAIQPLQREVEAYYAHIGRFPDGLGVEENDMTNRYESKRLIGVDIVQGAIRIRYWGSAVGQQTLAILTLRPAIDMQNYSRPIQWICGNSQDVPADYTVMGENETDLNNRHLPSECRS